MRKILLFIICFTLFSFLIFILENYFFSSKEKILHNYIEQNYIEPTLDLKKVDKTQELLELKKQEKIKVTLKSAYQIRFLFFPLDYQNKVSNYVDVYKLFLNTKIFKDKIDSIRIEFHEGKWDVRWKMKDHSIKMFWTDLIELSESFAVMVHEFGHFIDLYFLKKEIFTDISDYFYNISWEKTKILKWWMQQKDFVSGYSMTNKYEDFAESFTYFILHNDDFLEKSKKSDILKKKYDFFNTYLFRDKKFVNSNFSNDNIVLDYYRDITKIKFSLENFLEFLKK